MTAKEEIKREIRNSENNKLHDILASGHSDAWKVLHYIHICDTRTIYSSSHARPLSSKVTCTVTHLDGVTKGSTAALLALGLQRVPTDVAADPYMISGYTRLQQCQHYSVCTEQHTATENLITWERYKTKTERFY